ncbi:MAG: alpha/beta fold hydrolase [Candidatus Velthaea sp.]
MCAAIPRAGYVEIPDAGHACLSEQPAELIALMREHVDGAHGDGWAEDAQFAEAVR